MPGGYGRNTFIGWAEESAWGTPVAASKFGEIISSSMEAIRRRVPRESVRGLDDREANFYDELFGAAGSFVIGANYIGLLRLLEHAMGDGSDAITQPDVGVRWVHTFTLKDTLMAGKGLSLHVNDDVDNGGTPQRRYAGFKVNGLKFSYDPLRNTTIEVSGAAKDFASIAAVSPTLPGLSTYVAGHQTVIEIDDVVRKCDMVEVELDNGMDLEKRILGSKNIDEPIRGDSRRRVFGTIKMDAAAADLAKFDAGTYFKLEVLATGATLGTGNYALQLVLAKCRLDGDPYSSIDGPGVRKTEVPFVADLPTSGERLQVIVHNNESAVA